MASSRQMRRSRRASPMNITTPNSIPVTNEAHFENNHGDFSQEWVEPPLRAPVPSFEDYKGLERHGVLEHMAPLGSLPNSKVKARLKQHEPSRRVAHLKNGELRAAREEANTPEPVPLIATRRSEPRRTEEKVAKVPSSRERDDDCDYMPTLKSSTRAMPARAASIPTALHGTPSSRTVQGRLKLREIVDSAIKRSNDLGDPVLGDAVNEIYDESLVDPAVADLLDAVLTQRPTPQQTAEFQSKIRAARKKHKESSNGHNSASKTMITPPAVRSAVTRHTDSMKIPLSPSVLNTHPPDSDRHSPKQASDITEINGSPSNGERPSKRIKRSKSASSDSSLSSLDSAIDEELPPTLGTNHAPDQKLLQSKAQLPNGPRLGTFPIRSNDSSAGKPISLHLNLSTAADDAAAKKREEMRRKFNHVVGVRDSAIRSSPSPTLSPQLTPPIASLTERKQQGRLRNGSGRRRKKNDVDALDSPASSTFSELLIPPPPGASRGATPNQLGRPPKALKKAARIKMS